MSVLGKNTQPPEVLVWGWAAASFVGMLGKNTQQQEVPPVHMGAPATFVRGLGSRNFCEYVWHKYSATRSASMGLGSCKFCEYARQEYSATRSAPRAHRGRHLQGVIVAHLQGQFQITPSDRGNCGTPAGPNPGSPPVMRVVLQG